MKRFRKFLKYAIMAGVVLILLALSLPYAIPIAPYRNEIYGPFPESAVVPVEGAVVHYRSWMPEGEVKGNLVLVHGFCGSTFSWRHNVPFFVDQGFRVVAVDLPAFGYSDRSPDIDHGAAARSAYVWGAVDAVAESEGIAPEATWFLAGHSMGGGVVEAMAQLEPERTAGVIFVDGGGFGRGPGGGGFSARLRSGLMGFGPLRRWVEVYAKYQAFTEPNIRILLTSALGQAPDDEAVRGYLDALLVPRTASAILDQFRGRGAANVDLDPAKISVPVLVLWGEQDTWVPISRGERLHGAVEGSEMVVIPGAGHNVMETHADAFNAAALAFLNADRGAVEFDAHDG